MEEATEDIQLWYRQTYCDSCQKKDRCECHGKYYTFACETRCQLH